MSTHTIADARATRSAMWQRHNALYVQRQEKRERLILEATERIDADLSREYHDRIEAAYMGYQAAAEMVRKMELELEASQGKPT